MDLAFWRDVSIVFLAVQTFILLIIPLAILYFVVRGLNFLHVRLPRVLFRAQDISKEVRIRTEAVSERIADPLVKAEREQRNASDYDLDGPLLIWRSVVLKKERLEQ